MTPDHGASRPRQFPDPRSYRSGEEESRLDYVYLGCWVKNLPKMAYKALFAPLEVQNGPSAGVRSADPSSQVSSIFVIIALGLLRLGLVLATLGLATGAAGAARLFAVPAFDLVNHFQALLLLGLLVAAIAVPLFFIGRPWQLPLSGIAVIGLVARAGRSRPRVRRRPPRRGHHSRPTGGRYSS